MGTHWHADRGGCFFSDQQLIGAEDPNTGQFVTECKSGDPQADLQKMVLLPDDFILRNGSGVHLTWGQLKKTLRDRQRSMNVSYPIVALDLYLEDTGNIYRLSPRGPIQKAMMACHDLIKFQYVEICQPADCTFSALTPVPNPPHSFDDRSCFEATFEITGSPDMARIIVELEQNSTSEEWDVPCLRMVRQGKRDRVWLYSSRNGSFQELL